MVRDDMINNTNNNQSEENKSIFSSIWDTFKDFYGKVDEAADSDLSPILNNLDFFKLYKLPKPNLEGIKYLDGEVSDNTDIYGRFMPIILTSTGWGGLGDKDNFKDGWDNEEVNDNNSIEKKIRIILPYDSNQSLSDGLSTRIGFHNIDTNEYSKLIAEPFSSGINKGSADVASGSDNQRTGGLFGGLFGHVGNVIGGQVQKGTANMLRTVAQMVSMNMAGNDSIFDSMWLDYDPSSMQRQIRLPFVLPITEYLLESQITPTWCNEVRQHLGALMGLLYPKGIYKPVPYLMRLRLGNMYRGFKGYITSVDYTFSNDIVTAGSTQWPLLINGSISFTSIATYMWDPGGGIGNLLDFVGVGNGNGILGLTDYNIGKNPAVLFGTYQSQGGGKIPDQLTTEQKNNDLTLSEQKIERKVKDTIYYGDKVEIKDVLKKALQDKIYGLVICFDPEKFNKGMLYETNDIRVLDDALRTGYISEEEYNEILAKKQKSEIINGSVYDVAEKAVEDGKIIVITNENMKYLIESGKIKPIPEWNTLKEDEILKYWETTEKYKTQYDKLVFSATDKYRDMLETYGYKCDRTIVDKIGQYVRVDSGEWVNLNTLKKTTAYTDAINNIFSTTNSIYNGITKYTSALYNIYRNYTYLSELISTQGITVANVSNLFNNTSNMLNSLGDILGVDKSEVSIFNDSVYVNVLKMGQVNNMNNQIITSVNNSNRLTGTSINSGYVDTNTAHSSMATKDAIDTNLQISGSIIQTNNAIVESGTILCNSGLMNSSAKQYLSNISNYTTDLNSTITDLKVSSGFLDTNIITMATEIGKMIGG